MIYSKISELCELKPAKKEAKIRLKDSDLVSFIPMNALGIGEKNVTGIEEKPLSEVYSGYTYFAENDILLAKITPCFENGKLGIARNLKNSIGFGSSEYIVLRSLGKIDQEYLFYFLSQKKIRGEGSKVMTGAVGHKRVPNEFIENLEIFLPTLKEQKRIVAILDEAFAGISQAIANTEKNLANARELFESFIENSLSQSADSWTITKLGNEIELITGFAFKSQNYSEDKSDIKLLRGDNIIQGSLRWEDVKRWSQHDTEKYKDYFLNADDFVLAMDRTWVKAGIKFAQIQLNDLPCLLVQRVARLRVKNNLEPLFLKYLLQSRLFEKYVLGIQTGLGVPHISGKQISEFSFKKPSKRDQLKLGLKLNNISFASQSLIDSYQQKLQSLAELKQSLLQKAFSGELTANNVDKLVNP